MSVSTQSTRITLLITIVQLNPNDLSDLSRGWTVGCCLDCKQVIKQDLCFSSLTSDVSQSESELPSSIALILLLITWQRWGTLGGLPSHSPPDLLLLVLAEAPDGGLVGPGAPPVSPLAAGQTGGCRGECVRQTNSDDSSLQARQARQPDLRELQQRN